MKRIFISYSRTNAVFAERLARDLTEAGLETWIDFRKIRGGQAWREAIFEGIAQAEVIIVCLSPEAIQSEWVRREILMAQSQHKFVIPIMVIDCFDQMSRYDETKTLLNVQIISFEQPGYEQAFPRLLQAIPGLTTAERPEGDDIDPITIPNPFKGLEAFQETDAHLFFGREEAIEKMLNPLREGSTRFLAVVGASGSGKSSLVRAGLVPAIREGRVPGSETWPITVFAPGADPVEEMAKRLWPMISGNRMLPEVVHVLESDTRSLHQVVESILVNASPAARLMLIIDQFEEVFTRPSEKQRELFLSLVEMALKVEGGRTLIIITMRADFFGHLSSHPQLATLFEQKNMLIATEMEAENLRQSIYRQANAVGLVYADGLIERIIEDVSHQPGSLPLLQYALKGLYERRSGRKLTHEAYEQIGGVRGALAQHAEDTYLGLNDAARDTARRILLRLVDVGETGEATRRRVSQADLTFEGVSSSVLDEVISRLTAPESRLLTANRDIDSAEGLQSSPTIWLQVSHEALIRNWERFGQWVADNIEILHYGSDLLAWAHDWQKAHGDPEYLLRGTRLTRAETWLRTADASDLQRAFIQSGIAKRRVARRNRFWVIALVILLSVALVVGVSQFTRNKTSAALGRVFTPEIQHWAPSIRKWAEEYDIDANLIGTVMQIESCGWSSAVSLTGAQGLFVVEPFKFAQGEDMRDPETNARRAIEALKDAMKAAHGNQALAFGAYNAGDYVMQQSLSQWPKETQAIEYWATGIYLDAANNITPEQSIPLQDWLKHGGSQLCGQAAQDLGLPQTPNAVQ